MATKIAIKTTFEPTRTIEPISTGGEVAADASGQWLATCVDDDILIIHLETFEVRIRIEGDGEPVTSLCLSPSATHLVICSRSLRLTIYSLSLPSDEKYGSATEERSFKPHTAPVVATCIDDTGSLLATGSADSIVKIWDLRGGFATHTFHGHSGIVSSLCFFRSGIVHQKSRSKTRHGSNGDSHPEGRKSEKGIFLASGGEDGNIRIWDLMKKKSIATLQSHQAVIRSLSYSPEYQVLVSVGRDQALIIWDLQTYQVRRAMPTKETLESAGIMNDGRWAFAGGESGKVRLWDIETGKELTQLLDAGVETDAITSIMSNPSARTLVSIHQDQTFRVWSYRRVRGIDTHPAAIELECGQRISGNHDEIIDMAFVGGDDTTLALATNTENVRIISTSDGSQGSEEGKQTVFGSDVALLQGHKDIILCLDVDSSGKWVATGGKDNTARLWRVDPSESQYVCFAVLEGHAESLGAIALPKGVSKEPPTSSRAPPAYVLTGSQDRTIKRWDTSKLPPLPETGLNISHSNIRATYTRVAHEKDINAIDVSPTAQLFASASQDRTIKVWSLEDGSVAGILRGHKRGVWSIAFAPADASPLNTSDGGNSSRGLLVSGSGDRTVRVWSLSTFTCLLTFEGHSNSVLKVIWLWPNSSSNRDEDGVPNRKSAANQPIVASASSDTLIKLWNPYAPATSDHLLTTLDNHTDRVWALAAPSPHKSPEASPSQPISLISGAADARLTFWTDTTVATHSLLLTRSAARVTQSQLLSNHISARNYREAITLSLTLNHPARLLSLFRSLLALPPSERDQGSITGKQEVDDVLASLGHGQLYLLLCRCRDWNTNARTAPVAQRVLSVIFRRYPPKTFEEMARRQRRARLGGTDDDADDGEAEGAGGDGGTADGTGGRKRVKKAEQSVAELLRALEVYTERHYRRVEELMDESWILDFTIREMDSLVGDVGGGGVNGGGGGNAVGMPKRIEGAGGQATGSKGTSETLQEEVNVTRSSEDMDVDIEDD